MVFDLFVGCFLCPPGEAELSSRAELHPVRNGLRQCSAHHTPWAEAQGGSEQGNWAQSLSTPSLQQQWSPCQLHVHVSDEGVQWHMGSVPEGQTVLGNRMPAWFIPKQGGWCPEASTKQNLFYSRVNIVHCLESCQPALPALALFFPTGNVFQPLSIWLRKQLYFSSRFILFGMDAFRFHCAARLAVCGSDSSSQKPDSH